MKKNRYEKPERKKLTLAQARKLVLDAVEKRKKRSIEIRDKEAEINRRESIDLELGESCEKLLNYIHTKCPKEETIYSFIRKIKKIMEEKYGYTDKTEKRNKKIN